MRLVKPEVIKIAETKIDGPRMQSALEKLGYMERSKIFPRATTSAENLIEFSGRICYQSFEPGTVNPNVTKIRDDQHDYIGNIIKKGDGSIFEHATISFLFMNVSR